jgi:hypothetical protein
MAVSARSPRSQSDQFNPAALYSQILTLDASSRRTPAQRPRTQVAMRPRTARAACPAPRQKLPNARDIERLRQEVKASRPRQIQWGNTDPSFNQDLVSDGIVNPKDRQRPKCIMADADPIDIHAPPQPAKLISTTALVQEYIGVPNSLSFIR